MRIAVIGSGLSGLGAANVLVEKGHHVDVLDVGNQPEPWSAALTERLRQTVLEKKTITPEMIDLLVHGPDHSPPNPLIALFKNLFAISHPVETDRMVQKRILGSLFTYRDVESGIPQRGATSVPRSLALGGLSNVWGAACYPLRSQDFDDWPIAESDMAPYYHRAANLMSLWQTTDNLSSIYPIYGTSSGARYPNPGSTLEDLYGYWQQNRQGLREKNIFFGRSRLAVTQPSETDSNTKSQGCRQCGLCFFGCPFKAIFSSERILERLLNSGRCTLRSGLLVHRFSEQGNTVSVVARHTHSEEMWQETYDALFIATGPISTLRIVCDSLGIYGVPTQMLDNDMFLLPLVNTSKWNGGRFRSNFLLSELVLAMPPSPSINNGMHLQLYAFHPYFLENSGRLLIRSGELVKRMAHGVLNNILIGFLYPHSRQSRQAIATVKEGENGFGLVHVQITSRGKGPEFFVDVMKILLKNRKLTGLLPLSSFMKYGSFGLSAHIGGCLPMHNNPTDLQTHPNGLLARCQRVYVVDSSTLPSIPPPNSTLTVMANAMRIADQFV